MANQLKPELLAELKRRYGSLRKLDATQSLYEIGKSAARVYIRYSKLHARNQGFYGLREDDLEYVDVFGWHKRIIGNQMNAIS